MATEPAAQPQEANVTMAIDELLELHPLPWTHHLLLIKDANGRQVIHTGGSYNDRGRIYEGRYLSGLNALLVQLVNARADLPRATADSQAIIETIQDVQNFNDLDDGVFFEAGFIAAKTMIIDAVLDLFTATPRATGDTTVGAALAEIHQLMPEQFVTIESYRRDDLEGYGEVETVEQWVHIKWMRATRGRGETLSEAMAQFRDWAKEWARSRAATHTTGSVKDEKTI